MKQWKTSAFLIWPNNSQSNGRPLLAGAVTKRRRSRRRPEQKKSGENKSKLYQAYFHISAKNVRQTSRKYFTDIILHNDATRHTQKYN